MTSDVGTTRRGAMSTRLRLSIWEAHKGICCLCSHRIDGVRDKWIVEHVIALELGGADEPSNMAPAHHECAREKTKNDHASAGKAKRNKKRHIGIKKATTRPIPGSRASGIRKRMDGSVEQW